MATVQAIPPDNQRDVSTLDAWFRSHPQELTQAVSRGPTWTSVAMIQSRGKGLKEEPAFKDVDEKDLDVDCLSEKEDHPFGEAISRVLTSSLGSDKPQDDVVVLETLEDTPTNTEWPILAERFPSVKWLVVETGWNEAWKDVTFPQSWALEKLLISSACGELFSTPVVIDGQVRHLVLFLTCDMRFEGPSTEELGRMDELDEDIKEVLRDVASKNDNGGRRDIKIISIPHRAAKWRSETYKDGFTFPNLEPHKDKPPSQLETLEIIENNAIDTFIAMAVSCAHIMTTNLTRLNLRSTSGLDLRNQPASVFGQILALFTNLRELQLSVSGLTFGHLEEPDCDALKNLYQSFPPDLEVLEFRGPASLAQDEAFADWIAAFGNVDYLPKLRQLSFVLNTCSKESADSVDPETLETARQQTEKLLDAARARGVTVVEFYDPWMNIAGLR